MKNTINTRVSSHYSENDRKGFVLVLAAGLFVLVFAFAAFTIDVGYITLTKAQMQSAADAGALAAVIELREGLADSANDPETTEANARQAAVDVAATYKNGDHAQTNVRYNEDIRMGRRYWDDSLDAYQIAWGETPYNIVEVKVERSTAGGTSLPLFFAPIIGHSHAELDVSEVSRAALYPGMGFVLPPESERTCGALPIAMDLETWEAYEDGIGEQDKFTWDPLTGEVTPGPDGIPEINLYPRGKTSEAPGNRGTVDLGNPNNSTADLKRQILYGLNADDLSYFGGTISWADGPLQINGDTGISAGIKSQLTQIIGQPRAIPIFTEVSGPGNNAMYTVVKFVGVRIVEVKLTGKPSSKRVMIQRAPFSCSSLIRGRGEVTADSLIAPAMLLK